MVATQPNAKILSPSLRFAVSIDSYLLNFGINELATRRFSLEGRELAM